MMNPHKSNGTISLSNDYIISTSKTAPETFTSVGSTMFTNMNINKDKIAQIDAETGQTDTFGELLQRCIRTTLHLSDKNITREHIISICTSNHLNAAVPYISAQFLGAKIAPLHPSLATQEITHLLTLVRPRIIFATPESVPTLEKIIQDKSLNFEIVVFGQTDKHTEFSEFLEPHKNEKVLEPVKIENLRETAFIHFSSGSTGLPKGICLSHYSFAAHVMNLELASNPDFYYKQSVAKKMSVPLTVLSYSSLYWSVGAIILMGSITKGYRRLICDSFDGKEIWNLIQKYKPNIIFIRPAFVKEILANKREDVDVQCVLCILILGSHTSKGYFLKLQKVFPEADISGPYGQTETGTITVFKPDDPRQRQIKIRDEKIESVGLPVEGVTYKVVDTESEKNLGPGQRGELRIKSKFLLSGYYNQDSSETFDEDSWLKTGDIAYYDEDYCFYIVDRIKDAFKYQGWFIAPTLLENELLLHPAVKQAVVIGVPQEDGHHPMGLVVVNQGFQVSEEEIEKFVEDRVPDRQRLRAGVKFIKFVPVTPTGKVRRRELRDMVLNGKL